MELQPLVSSEDMHKTLDFFYSKNAFHWELFEGEKKSMRTVLGKALDSSSQCRYWIVKNDQGNVIAAGGIEAHPEKGGFYLGWFDDNPNANSFYQSIGYRKVGHIPEFFEDKSGKVIYYKKIE